MANAIIPPSVPIINFAWIGSNPIWGIHNFQCLCCGTITHVTAVDLREWGFDARISCGSCQRSGGLAIVPKHAPKEWTA